MGTLPQSAKLHSLDEIVILSEGFAQRSEANPQSKDPYLNHRHTNSTQPTGRSLALPTSPHFPIIETPGFSWKRSRQ